MFWCVFWTLEIITSEKGSAVFPEFRSFVKFAGWPGFSLGMILNMGVTAFSK